MKPSAPLFRTPVPLPKPPFALHYQTPTLWIGSCFTHHIGERLQQAKLPTCLNPFGVLYNPVSIANALHRLLQRQYYTANQLLYHHDRWLSLDHHHAQFSATDPQQCLHRINTSLEQAAQFLEQTQVVFLTFGSAWVHRWNATGQVVANCHKIPAAQFSKQLLTIDEIVTTYTALISQLLAQNPALHLVFTLSPVRHTADGAVGNQHSKALLLVAIHQIIARFAQQCHYLPAYELMLDELRDYRFYAPDMLHPNTIAIDYIWQQFRQQYLTNNAQQLGKQIAQLHAAVAHRPFDAQAAAHQQFVAQTLAHISQLEQLHPYLDFSNEKKTLEQQLSG